MPVNQRRYPCFSQYEREAGVLWRPVIQGEFSNRVVIRAWLHVAISDNIRQALTAVWKKNTYEEKLLNFKLSGFRGGGLPLWEAKYRCWPIKHCQIYLLTITWVLAISGFLGCSSKTPAGASVGFSNNC